MEYKVLALGDVASETGLQLLEKKLRAFKRSMTCALPWSMGRTSPAAA